MYLKMIGPWAVLFHLMYIMDFGAGVNSLVELVGFCTIGTFLIMYATINLYKFLLSE